jgi:5-(carboxyamino)imidazole ribonucleotide mutase
MAAHLAGAIAAQTTKPVLGIPLGGGDLDGIDSLLATVQMPKGVPVATFAIGKSGAINAALCAVQMLGTTDEKISDMLTEYKSKMHDDVLAANESIQ